MCDCIDAVVDPLGLDVFSVGNDLDGFRISVCDEMSDGRVIPLDF